MVLQSVRNEQRQGLDPALPRLLGERLCLDFANSIKDPAGSERHDFLSSYADLVRWGRHVGEVSEPQAALLSLAAERQPVAAQAVLARAIALREAIDRVFRAVAQGAAPAPRDLAAVRQAHLAALAHANLSASDGGIAWAWPEDDPALERMLWPVAQSAVDLLLTGDPARIRECCPEAGGCTWLFYDTSRNGARRWCSMEGCGSRVKMRRYHARRRAAKA